MAWVWGGNSVSPLRFEHGPLPENPPLTEVIIQGNIVYDSGHDQPLVDGVPKRERPRYRWAVRIETNPPNPPQGLHFIGNLFHPGTDGVSNTDLTP